jgi:hypothetical protein
MFSSSTFFYPKISFIWHYSNDNRIEIRLCSANLIFWHMWLILLGDFRTIIFYWTCQSFFCLFLAIEERIEQKWMNFSSFFILFLYEKKQKTTCQLPTKYFLSFWEFLDFFNVFFSQWAVCADLVYLFCFFWLICEFFFVRQKRYGGVKRVKKCDVFEILMGVQRHCILELGLFKYWFFTFFSKCLARRIPGYIGRKRTVSRSKLLVMHVSIWFTPNQRNVSNFVNTWQNKSFSMTNCRQIIKETPKIINCEFGKVQENIEIKNQI